MIKVDETSRLGNYSVGNGHSFSAKNGMAKATAYAGAVDSTSFTGAAADLSWLAKLKKNLFPKGKELTEVQQKILDMFPTSEKKWFKSIQSVSDFIKGEMGGIIVTAVGTGLVAPFPIAFNPFTKAGPNATKEEKEEVRKTKAYSAWRQPISAVLAVLIQASVQKPIDRFLQNLTNDADTAKLWKGWVLNQTSLNDEKYLERQVKKDFKKGNLSLRDGEIIDNKGKVLGKAAEEKAAIKEIKSQRIEQQMKLIAESLEKDGIIKMGEFNISDRAVAEVVNDTIDKYVEKIKRLQKGDKIEYYKNKAEFLTRNEEELKQLLSKNSFKNLPRFKDVIDGVEIERIDYKALKTHLEGLIDKASNQEIKDELRRIIKKPDSVRETACASTLWRIGEIRKACGGEFDSGKYEQYLINQNKELQNRINALNDLKFKDLKGVTPEQIKATIAKFPEQFCYDGKDESLRKIFGRSSLFSPKIEKLQEKVYKDVAKTYKEFTANKFGIFKQMSKIAVGVVVTLPITCTVLNWIYPRFMNIFFPGLAGVKKEADAKKFGGVK